MSLGIIGGADGPTAVLVASSPVPLWFVALGAAAAVAIVAALIIILLKKK